MKKYLIAVCLLSLVLSGCGKSQPAEETTLPAVTQQTQPETEMTQPAETQPVETEPATVAAVSRADGVAAVMGTLARGEKAELKGDYDDTYVWAETKLGLGLIEKRLLRHEDAPGFESYSGFSRYGTKIYEDLSLSGSFREVPVNTALEVLEDLGTCLLVQEGENLGYVEKDMVSMVRTQTGSQKPSSHTPEKPRPPVPTTPPAPGGQDGGDIEMESGGFVTFLAETIIQGEITGRAMILADGTPQILKIYNRLDPVPVLKQEDRERTREGFCTVYENGSYGYIPDDLLRMPGEKAYEAWTGYVQWPGELYDNYLLRGKPWRNVSGGRAIQILDELGNCYVAELDGKTVYIEKTQVGASAPVSKPGSSQTPQKNPAPVPNPEKGDGGWTPPVM